MKNQITVIRHETNASNEAPNLKQLSLESTRIHLCGTSALISA